MAQNSICEMLKAWDNHIIEYHPRSVEKIPIPKDDMAKLNALAEVYQLPLEDIIASVLSSALREVEEKIPYVPGTNIIRVEEGEPIYDDVGHTPAYLQAKNRYEKQQAKAS